MPPSNYSMRQFRYILAAKLNQLSSIGIIYTITSSSAIKHEIGLFTFKKTGGNLVRFIFTDSVYDQMGFYANTSPEFIGDILVSKKVVNFNKHDCIYIQSNICTNSNGKAILQEVLTSGVEPFASIKFTNPNPLLFAKRMSNSRSNTFNFFLTDEDDNPLNLHGLKLRMTVMVYKSNRVFDLLYDTMKFLVHKLTND